MLYRLYMIIITKMWFEWLSSGYRLLLEEFYAEVEQIWFGIRLLKNCEHDGHNFTCEYNDRTTEQQYSIRTSLVGCLFKTKYVIEMKDIAHGIRHAVIMTFFVTKEITWKRKLVKENWR